MNSAGVTTGARARFDRKVRRQSLRKLLTGRTPFVPAAPAGKIRLMHHHHDSRFLHRQPDKHPRKNMLIPRGNAGRFRK